ncbi:hypothetical protein DBR39_01400 [Chryseobacterium sp. KBW03]|uniref:porin family protein n=1 Tax=Chryseobacterium sp. KBW03 TaxID=2153362 RepID=UPI000F5B0792|nr:porin family protein [Chryseobacterium sp. KBW03]RQO42561.1 hypothetical protein DBR39_01400 [Chryseobacterium sp. KBW03]
MKKTVLILASVLITSVATAQKISIEPELGLNFSNIKTKFANSSSESEDSKIGFRGGLGIKFLTNSGLYLKSGLYYSGKGAQNSSSALGDFKTHLNYLELPVNIGYHYNINGGQYGAIFAEAGPYIGYAVGGKIKGTNIPLVGTSETKIDFGDGASQLKAFDWGFNFGAGYQTPWGIYIKGGYGLGLGNMSNINNVSATNKLFNLSLGYSYTF